MRNNSCIKIYISKVGPYKVKHVEWHFLDLDTNQLSGAIAILLAILLT